MIKEINTIEDVKLFAFQLISDENLSFHPDNDFADYINMETGEATYSVEEVELRNNLMAKCFDICSKNEVDIYELMGQPLYEKLKIGDYAV